MTERLPPFASTPAEIRQAVEQNAIDRGNLLIKVIVSLNIDGIIDELDQLAVDYDKEDWRENAQTMGIDKGALDLLDASEPPIPYTYYFSSFELFLDSPHMIFYYRNVAMLSSKVMRGIGLDCNRYEVNGEAPPFDKAMELSKYFNKLISKLIQDSGVSKNRHLAMFMSNLGDSMGGISRNEVGRVAMMRVLNPLVAHLHQEKRLRAVICSFKGELKKEFERSNSSQKTRIEMDSTTDLEALLADFEKRRVKYHELVISNGNRLLVDRQLKWREENGNTHKIGPDLHSTSKIHDFVWAAEVKGGADPAGSDEHWKTATQALDRIIQACEKTNRCQPALAFIATIFVGRVATEAQAWIEQEKLTGAYNLTRMLQEPQDMERFCTDVTEYLTR